MNLIACELRIAPFGTMQLIGFDYHNKEPFRAQAFASHVRTVWTDKGTVRCVNGYSLPKPEV